jgi:hypothetical protein
MVWEDVWATKFAQAARDAGGILVDRRTVPYEIVQAAVDWAAENAAPASA